MIARRSSPRASMLWTVALLGAANASCNPPGPTEDEGQVSSALGSADIVVSQVYGGGGNAGATYKNDFIELFNRGGSAVNVSGWSVQYASAGGSTWTVTNLTGTIQPGHYYLVKEAQGTGGTTNLPTPDATGTISMSATSGKVALVRSQTALTCGSGCVPSASIADFVGYGSSATSFEGSGPTATLDNTSAALRAAAGCTDGDNNAADFAKATVTPRNSSSPAGSCGGGAGTGGASGAGGTRGTGGASGTGGSGGTITLPSPTIPQVIMPVLTFGMTGDTRPPSSTTGAYPASVQSIIDSVFAGFQAHNLPLAVGSGDYAFSSTNAGDALPQYHGYMSARAGYSGTFLPTMGNHECNGFTNSNCPVGSFTGMTQDYVNTILTPSTNQSSPHYSALYRATDGSWSAKFVFVAANAWSSSQQSWLQATLAVHTTYTFIVRHEPANDARAPGVTPSESLMSSAFNAGNLTLSITGHTHLVQLPGGTQPYGDPFGSTLAYEMIVGNGGAPLDAGPSYGYAVATRRASDGAIVTQMYKSADTSGNPIVPNVADSNFRFAVNADGSSNGNTTLP